MVKVSTQAAVAVAEPVIAMDQDKAMVYQQTLVAMVEPGPMELGRLAMLVKVQVVALVLDMFHLIMLLQQQMAVMVVAAMST
jgi:hypothetical protein